MRYLHFYGEAQEFKTCQISIGLSEKTCLYSASSTSANLPTNYQADPFEILFLRLDFGLMSYTVSEQIKIRF